ncbi:MAG: serine hydrolase [Bacteroidota bacterium]
MKGKIKGIYSWGLLALLAMITVVSACRYSFQNFGAYSKAHFEYTVWADTLKDSTLWGVPVVRVSDREATKASLVLLQNRKKLIPIRDLKNQRFHLVTLGGSLPRFEEYLNYYTAFSSEQILNLEGISAKEYGIYGTVVVALNQSKIRVPAISKFLSDISKQTNLVLVNFDEYDVIKPYIIHSSIIQAHNNNHISQELTAQLLFGGIPAIGYAPDEVLSDLGLRERYHTEALRLGYTFPEYVGISSDSLARIANIVQEGIDNFAMPGAQILVAKEGQVIFHEAFGYHTYSRKKAVKKSDIYDLASITKVASTTLAAMRLMEEGKLGLNDKLVNFFNDPTYTPGIRKLYDTIPKVDYLAFLDSVKLDTSIKSLPDLDTLSYQDSLFLVGRWVLPPQKRLKSKVFDVQLKELLTHTSGLQATLPIRSYQQNSSSRFYSNTSDQEYTVPVANGLYLNQTHLDSLWNIAKGLRVRRDSNAYEYSCVNMVLMQRVIDSINQQSISDYVHETFYQELGMQTMGYNPLEIFSRDKLVPTSTDRWRGQLLCGTVHDPTAALMGGVSGNAGLFSNANDLAILGQLLLNKGKYGGKQYLSQETVDLFTHRQRGHRGYGFDMPPRNHRYIVAESAPYSTYGHTGFTGTAFWVDPENELVFIFLSNRVHPSERNFKINELRIRQRVQQVVYDALGIPFRPVPTEKPKEKKTAQAPLMMVAR